MGKMTELERLEQERVIIEKVLTRLNIVMNDLSSEPAVRKLVAFQFGDKLLKDLINSMDNYDVLNFHIPTDDEGFEFYIKACVKMEENKKEIDLSNLPEEPFVDVLDPEDNVIWHGNNVLHFDYIILQIKRSELTGYKIRTESGNIYEIDEHGRFTESTKYGEIPGDIWMKIVEQLL